VQKSIRPHSDWIARYGGEEFLLVLPETDFKAGVFVAEKVRELIRAAPFATRAGEIAVTASFGVAATGPAGPDFTLKVEALIKSADQCLYRSKEAGRDCTRGIEIPTSPARMMHG
jgi:diguanylate cyclase (GGDEF)-like protein